MCILMGKWFPEQGWVGAKNRDRNYIPNISFRKVHHNGSEILYFWDDITQYCEGFNNSGVSILSASLMVLDDEKEIETRTRKPSPDGVKIKRALKANTLSDAVNMCIDQKLPGNTLIWDKQHMVCLEGAWRPGEYDRKGYAYHVEEILRNQTVTRTNHGVWLPWAGYQRGKSKSEYMSRVSSESRKLIADWVADQAETPEQLIDLLTVNYTNDPQLNALRTTHARKKMRTTSQVLIVPEQRTMFVRPVQSHIHYNFWKMNHPQQQTWVELLSNRVLYQNLKAHDLDGHAPFRQNLNHKMPT